MAIRWSQNGPQMAGDASKTAPDSPRWPEDGQRNQSAQCRLVVGAQDGPVCGLIFPILATPARHLGPSLAYPGLILAHLGSERWLLFCVLGTNLV